jgi:chromosome segregation protein
VGDRDAAAGEAGAARREAESAGHEAEALQSERDSQTGRLSSLEEMVATHSAFDEGVRALLQRPASGPPGTCAVIGVVADALEADSEHERGVEAFLGDRLQYVLTPHAGHAVRHLHYLAGTSAGRVTFLAVDGAIDRAGERGCARSPTASRRCVGCSAPSIALTASTRPPSAPPCRKLVVETLEDAFDLISRQGPLACATLAGESVRGAMVEGGRGVKGLLAPRREIRRSGAAGGDHRPAAGCASASAVAPRPRRRRPRARARESIHRAKRLVALY